jgi:hypothetical protein
MNEARDWEVVAVHVEGDDEPLQRISETMPQYLRAAIGSIVLSFIRLEHEMEFLLWEMMLIPRGHQQIGRTATANLNFRARLDLFGALASYHMPDDASKKELVRVLKAVDKAGTERNRFIHGMLAHSSRDQKAVVLTSRTRKEGHKSEGRRYSRDELDAVEGRITEATQALQKVGIKVMYKLGRVQGAPPPKT